MIKLYTKQYKTDNGFTLVELLIVIVVIAILAAITIVAYNGVSGNARNSVLKADLAQAAQKLETYKVDNNGNYPNILSDAQIGNGSGLYAYRYSATTNSYCLTESNASAYSYVTNVLRTPQGGTCDGINGWWLMNGDGSDSSGNANSVATLTAVSGQGQNNNSTGAYVFDGTTSTQFAINDSPSLDPTMGITVSAWVKVTAYNTVAGASGVVSKDISGTLSNPPYALVVNGTGTWVGSINTASNAVTSPTCPNILSLGVWYFLVMTADGANVTNYQNGNKCIQAATTSLPGATTGMLRIGQQKNGMNRWLTGSIDDVRVYGRALNQDEISALYAAGAQ